LSDRTLHYDAKDVAIDPRSIADAAIRAHGAEIFGLLVAVYGRSDAQDIYGAFAEGVARAARDYRGDASPRTWAYAIARKAGLRHVRDQRRRRALLSPLDHHPSALDRRARSQTLGPSAERRLEHVRARLSRGDRELLILRVDRGFTFAQIAGITRASSDRAALAREEARLRQRYAAIKRRLAGWLAEEQESA
jgi:RNA polymerase sigma-70 factor, ECF subfamily